MAMTGNLLVTPEKVLETSGEFSGCMSQVRSLTSSMMDLVQGTTSFWEGEAATAYQNKFKELQTAIEEINKRVNAHTTALNDIAIEYQKGEKSAQEIAGSLGTLSGNIL